MHLCEYVRVSMWRVGMSVCVCGFLRTRQREFVRMWYLSMWTCEYLSMSLSGSVSMSDCAHVGRRYFKNVSKYVCGDMGM